MANVKQFEGDFRLWKKASNGDLTPVLPSDTDPQGNIPVEANAAVFSYAPGDEKKITSKRRDRYEQTIYSELLPGESSLSLTLLELPGAILARIFYGDQAETSVVSGTITAAPTTITLANTWYSLGHRYFNPAVAVVVKDVTDTTTYVEGEDYILDRRNGQIKIPATGSDIDPGDVVHVSGSYLAYKVLTIRGGVQPQETFYITADMLNRPDKQDMSIEIYEAKLGNDGDVDLFSSDPLTATMTGPLITPSDKNEPYVVRAYTK